MQGLSKISSLKFCGVIMRFASVEFLEIKWTQWKNHEQSLVEVYTLNLFWRFFFNGFYHGQSPFFTTIWETSFGSLFEGNEWSRKSKVRDLVPSCMGILDAITWDDPVFRQPGFHSHAIPFSWYMSLLIYHKNQQHVSKYTMNGGSGMGWNDETYIICCFHSCSNGKCQIFLGWYITSGGESHGPLQAWQVGILGTTGTTRISSWKWSIHDPLVTWFITCLWNLQPT